MARRSSGVVVSLRSSEGSSPRRNTFTGQDARARRLAAAPVFWEDITPKYTVVRTLAAVGSPSAGHSLNLTMLLAFTPFAA